MEFQLVWGRPEEMKNDGRYTVAANLNDSELTGLRPGYFENFLDDRDYLHTLVHNIDWQSQLEAVRLMLSRNRAAGKAFTKAINEDEAEIQVYAGNHHSHWIDHNNDMKYESVYRDAAESMAAIGMIAPLVESTIGQALAALGDMYDRHGIRLVEHDRWKRAGSHNLRWNCQYYFNKDNKPQNNIILGLPQLVGACDLKKFLPPEFTTWFEAMFTYRNFMFHGGFEWTIERRDLFEKEIEENGWDPYFTWSKTNGRPWVFYIKDDVIEALPTKSKRCSIAWVVLQNHCRRS